MALTVGSHLRRTSIIVLLLAVTAVTTASQRPRPGNPVFPGWYADPEAHVFDGKYWIYPTYSAPYDQQVFMDAFSSTDLVTWEKHPRVLEIGNVKWGRFDENGRILPVVITKDGVGRDPIR